MRQRITYILNATHSSDTTLPTITDKKLSIKSLKAAKEHRLSLEIDELPQPLRAVLERSQELYVRWISPRPYPAVAPFVARLSPGLHVIYTAPRNHSDENLNLCQAIKDVFSPRLKCVTSQESFIEIPISSENSTSSQVLQYHHHLPSLEHLIEYLRINVCADSGNGTVIASCHEIILWLRSVGYLDINYDTVSRILTVIGFWHAPSDPDGWTQLIEKTDSNSTVEVGVLQIEKSMHLAEMALAGLLTVVGEDDESASTRFSFPSRHHSAPSSTFTAGFLHPTGLHPTLRVSLRSPSNPFHHPLSLSSSSSSSNASCSLYTYLTLPSTLFVDQYQFSDPLFLASKNINRLRTLYGETDLEKPDWVIRTWGSALLLDLSTPSINLKSRSRWKSETSQGEGGDDDGGGDWKWNIDIPLHLRYLSPSTSSSSSSNSSIEMESSSSSSSSSSFVLGIHALELPLPVVTFWACPSSVFQEDDNDDDDDDDGIKLSSDNNPFDRVHLGYDLLFEPNTLFWHWTPSPSSSSSSSSSSQSHHHPHRQHDPSSSLLIHTIDVPVLDLQRSTYLEIGTVLVVLLAFSWLCWSLMVTTTATTTATQKHRDSLGRTLARKQSRSPRVQPKGKKKEM